jgi:hypothetical protein
MKNNDVAQTYRANRWQAFPIANNSKRPNGEWGPYQIGFITEEEFKRMHTWPNVGIVAGRISKLVVLDEDDPERFQAWLADSSG